MHARICNISASWTVTAWISSHMCSVNTIKDPDCTDKGVIGISDCEIFMVNLKQAGNGKSQ